MGCDIHPYVEKKIDGDWHMICDLKAGSYNEWGWGGQRDYQFFASLCGVRGGGDGPEPKGLPDDVSVVCQHISDRWGCDGHSHSWETVQEFVEKKMVLAKMRGDHNDSGYSIEYYEWKVLGFEIHEDEDRNDYRVVFWFDN